MNQALYLLPPALAALPFLEAGLEIAKRRIRPRSRRNDLMIKTPGVLNPWRDGELTDKLYFPYATFLYGNSKEKILNVIKGHVQVKGTLDELVIDAHGLPNSFFPLGNEEFVVIKPPKGETADRIDAMDFLNSLYAEQKQLDTQIAKRIVFTSCVMFTNLSSQDVEAYRDLSCKLNTEIVGATSRHSGDFFRAARMIQFNPNGKIKRDKYDRPYSPRTWIAQLMSRWGGYSSAWTKNL